MSDGELSQDPALPALGSAAAAEESRGARVLLPLIVLVILVGGTLLLWRQQRAKDEREAEGNLRGTAERLAARISRKLESDAGPLARFAGDFRNGRVHNADQFMARMQLHLRGIPTCDSVGWIGADNTCVYAWQRGEEADLKVGADLSMRPPWSYGLARARVEGEQRVVAIEWRRGQAELCVITPVISGEGPASAYLGSVAARLAIEPVLMSQLQRVRPDDFDAQVEDRGKRLIGIGQTIPPEDESSHVEAARVLNQVLDVRLRRSGPAVSAANGRSYWILLAGLPLSLLIALGLWRILEHRARLVKEARREVAALEELSRSSGVIAANSESSSEALHRLAASSRRILGVSTACVAVVDQQHKTVEIIAHDGLGPVNCPLQMPLDQAVGTKHCVTTGEILVVDDVNTDARINRAALLDLGLRAAIFVPLNVAGRVTGALYFGHDRPRRFVDADVRMAAVLGSQAGVILANHRLAQQKDEALREQRKLAVQREALYQIASEIYRFENLEDSLQRLADTAPAILGVDLCTVNLRPGSGETTQMRITAATENYSRVRGEVFDSTGTPAERAWRDQQVVVIEDVSAEPSVHPAYRHRLHIESAMYLPLIGTGKQPIGVLVLIRHRRGSFTAEQQELASALAARAAAAIEKARLYQEAQRYAQTQEMLLRELNHRVKNNLASIVSLLTLNRPPMTDQARFWVSRVTARVATMARTHELFVGGNQSVGLAELVTKLLPALGVIKPAGVSIRTELAQTGIQLDVERAVSLAMVLNELCWNALEHGTGPEGVVTIRARQNNAYLIVEVEDQGGGTATPPDRSSAAERPSRGMGLRLVEGLVARELGGKFSLENTAAGGMLARVDMPLAETPDGGLSYTREIN